MKKKEEFRTIFSQLACLDRELSPNKPNKFQDEGSSFSTPRHNAWFKKSA
jgi:hypothetical protein